MGSHLELCPFGVEAVQLVELRFRHLHLELVQHVVLVPAQVQVATRQHQWVGSMHCCRHDSQPSRSAAPAPERAKACGRLGLLVAQPLVQADGLGQLV